MFGFTKTRKTIEVLDEYCRNLIEENVRLRKAINVYEKKKGKPTPDEPKDVSYLKGALFGLELSFLACLYTKDDGYHIIPDHSRTMKEIEKYIERYKYEIKKLKKRLTK